MRYLIAGCLRVVWGLQLPPNTVVAVCGVREHGYAELLNKLGLVPVNIHPDEWVPACDSQYALVLATDLFTRMSPSRYIWSRRYAACASQLVAPEGHLLAPWSGRSTELRIDLDRYIRGKFSRSSRVYAGLRIMVNSYWNPF